MVPVSSKQHNSYICCADISVVVVHCNYALQWTGIRNIKLCHFCFTAGYCEWYVLSLSCSLYTFSVQYTKLVVVVSASCQLYHSLTCCTVLPVVVVHCNCALQCTEADNIIIILFSNHYHWILSMVCTVSVLKIFVKLQYSILRLPDLKNMFTPKRRQIALRSHYW